jgi:hemoglobin
MNFIKPSERIPLSSKIGRDAIDKVVDDFYNQIQTHPTLSKPFSIVNHWDEHKEKIADFWWVVLGGQPTSSYKYDPVNKHFLAGFTQDLLADWKKLFFSVLSKHLFPELAQAWQDRVEMIGENLSKQNDRLVQNSNGSN